MDSEEVADAIVMLAAAISTAAVVAAVPFADIMARPDMVKHIWHVSRQISWENKLRNDRREARRSSP